MTTSTSGDDFQVRVLGPEDADALANVAPDVFDDPIVWENARAFLNDARHHLVAAFDADVIVGFISAVHYLHPDKPHAELWINEVGVAPAHRQREIGRAMLEAMLAHAKRNGCAEAWVLTDRSNQAALALYARCGGDAPSDQVMIEFRLRDPTPVP